MYHIAIVEDCPEDSNLLVEYLNRYEAERDEKFKIEQFANGLNFVEDYHPDFDIVLMDIEMPHLDGMATARKMREMDSAVCLIFVTNMAQYAIEGYEVGALDYLLKPIPYQHFALKLERAIRNREARRERYFSIQSPEGFVRLPISHIYYVVSEKHYLCFTTQEGIYRQRGLLKELSAQLPGQTFARCHTSYLLNMDYVERVGQNTVTVKGQELPISRTCKKEFMDSFARYLGGNH